MVAVASPPQKIQKIQYVCHILGFKAQETILMFKMHLKIILANFGRRRQLRGGKWAVASPHTKDNMDILSYVFRHGKSIFDIQNAFE